MRRIYLVLSLVLMMATANSLMALSTGPATLPDAPLPVPNVASMPQAGAPPVRGAAGGRVRYAPLYARTIFPGETAQHLTPREKFLYAGRQVVEPIDLAPAIFSAGWSQYINSDPRYGTGSSAFAQRFGAAMARENSDRLFTDALLPILLHEDPRYYRLGESASTFRRSAYAIGQTFVARTDGGKEIPNYSGFIGRAMAMGLTYAYYPAASRNGGVVLRGFGASLGGLVAFNLLREFVSREVFSHLTIFRQPDSSQPVPETR